jgi:hypothetical protein
MRVLVACEFSGTDAARQHERSRTFPGIAAAMAEQWSGDLTYQMTLDETRIPV